MWLAAFWDGARGDYDKFQDWDAGDGSMWNKDMVKLAGFCHHGLERMQAYKAYVRHGEMASLSASVSVPRPAPRVNDQMEDFLLACMIRWCRRVKQGIMAHGPLLAHAVQSGHLIVTATAHCEDEVTRSFLAPKERHATSWLEYDWQAHGRDALVAITKYLQANGFWTEPVMPVQHLRPPKKAQNKREKNQNVLADCVPREMWKEYDAPRGVELAINDPDLLDNYEWVQKEGLPQDVEQCFKRPASCSPRSTAAPASTSSPRATGSGRFTLVSAPGPWR